MRLSLLAAAVALAGCSSPAGPGPIAPLPDAGRDARGLGAAEQPDVAPDAGAPCVLICLQGCCDVHGACQSGMSNEACGSSGAACEPCSQGAEPYAPSFCVPAYLDSDAGPMPAGGQCCAQGQVC